MLIDRHLGLFLFGHDEQGVFSEATSLMDTEEFLCSFNEMIGGVNNFTAPG